MSLRLFTILLNKGVLSSLVPVVFDDTRVFTLNEQYDINRYMLTGAYVQNPIRKNIVVHVFPDGISHYVEFEKRIGFRKSTDYGQTFNTRTILADSPSEAYQDCSAGYDKFGRLHVFYDSHSQLDELGSNEIRYTWSDDDGETWSAHVSIPYNPDTYELMRTLGSPVECADGTLVKTISLTNKENTVQGRRLVIRSADRGATWSQVTVHATTTEQLNESSMEVYGNSILHVTRKEASGKGYRFSASHDSGATWTVLGDTTFGDTLTWGHPAMLGKFKLDGVDVFACYYTDRASGQCRVIYGKPADVLASVSGWNQNTKLTYMDFQNIDSTAREPSGYGMVAHINGDLFARGMQYMDFNYTSETHVLYFDMPTTHYSNLKTQLGITTNDVFWVVGDSLANGTNNRTGEVVPNPKGALLEWNGSSFVSVMDTAGANTGTQYPQFAITYEQSTGRSVYLVESASGGSEFYPNGDTNNWYTSGTLYSAARTNLQSALTVPNTTLKGVILLLGINDARGSNNMLDIKIGMDSLIERINTDFNAPPVYMMQIGRAETGYTTRVREVQQLIRNAANTYSNVKIAGHLEGYDTLGYYGPDNLHLTQPGNNFLGSSLAGYAHSPATYFDKAIPFTLTQNYDISRYLFTGQIAQNPVSKKVVHLMHNGTTHGFNVGKKLSGRISTNGGDSYGSIFDIVVPTTTGIQDVSNGYSANGRLHVIYDEHESHQPGVQHWIRYVYSDDDGATWSTPVDLGLPPNGHTTFRVIGKIIENNGVLMKPYYSSTDEGQFGTISSRWLLRSTDGGATWNHILLETTAAYINEAGMLAHGNEVLYVARIEDVTGTTDDANRWKIYKSSDNGLTWAVQGLTGLGESFGYAHPSHIEKFKIEGVDVAVNYFLNRDNKEYKAIYGRLSDVMAGTAGWNVNTKINLLDFDTYGGAARSGYGAFFHPNGDLKAKGVVYSDHGDTTKALYFDLPTTHYENIKTQLGIGLAS